MNLLQSTSCPMGFESEAGQLEVNVDAEGRLHIPRADPKVLLSDHALKEFVQGCPDFPPEAEASLMVGTLIRIRSGGRSILYRLVRKCPCERLWVAQWPD